MLSILHYRLFLIVGMIILAFGTARSAHSAPLFKVKIKLPSASYSVNAISKDGVVYAGKPSANKSTISIPASKLAGSSLYLTNSGQFIGPVYAPDGSKGRLVFVKSPTDLKKKKLTNISLTLETPTAGQNYGLLKRVVGNVFDKKYKYTPASTPSLGLNISRISSRASIRAFASSDSDGDGVVDSLDVDLDGDGISNIADTSNSSSDRVSGKADTGVAADVPFTSLYLAMNESLNWHINGSLSQSAIDAVIAGENKFAIAFFFALGEQDSASISGGHVVCDSSLLYCRPTSGGQTGSGVYSGFSEGNQSLIGQLWSSITTDGSEYSLENFSVGGQAQGVYGASIQPRIGTSNFRPGNNYRVDFTDDQRRVVTSKTLTLPPYFLTAPAANTYNTTGNDASGDVTVNYSDPFGVGMNNSNPIVLASSGDFAGKLRLNVWRLQRLAVLPDETGSEYRDFGNLNYGLIINNNSGEFSCGGLYSGLSSTLSEVNSVGNGGSYSSQQGAILWPLVDSSSDYQPSNDSTLLSSNSITFTTDLTACRIRNGLAPGTYQVIIMAAGADTGHGANRAAQMINVAIP